MNNDDYSSSSLDCDMHEQSRIADVYLLIFSGARWRQRAHTLPHEIKAKFRRPLTISPRTQRHRRDVIFSHDLHFVILSWLPVHSCPDDGAHEIIICNVECVMLGCVFVCNEMSAENTESAPTHRQIPVAGFGRCSFTFISSEWHSFVSIFNIYVNRGSEK